MLLKATFLTGITSLNVGLLQLKGLKQIVQVYLHIKFKGLQRCILKGLKQIVQVLLTYLIQRVYKDVF